MIEDKNDFFSYWVMVYYQMFAAVYHQDQDVLNFNEILAAVTSVLTAAASVWHIGTFTH